MYVYQAYPSQDFPIALIRSQDGLWETAEVYSNKQWKHSIKAGFIFSLHTSDDGEYITETEALKLMNVLNIDVGVDSWESRRSDF